MNRNLSRPLRLVCVLMVVCVLLLSCGLTALAAEEGSTDVPATEPTPTAVADEQSTEGEENTPPPEDIPIELYPTDVQTVIEDTGRRIVKTYILTADESPADIPRANFTSDGWNYTLADITQQRTSGTDTRAHTEAVEINTDSNDLNKIIEQLSPTLEYESEDGYCGIITLDLTSVKCEAAGYKNSSYTVSATREYPHLSTNDTSLVPKTITDNGRTLELDGVTWEVQNYITVDYDEIPESYRAVATYTAKASRSVVTGYITTAEYTGEIVKTVTGDTVYTVYFSGSEIEPEPTPTPTPEPTPTPTATPTPVTDTERGALPIVPLIIVAVIAALVGGAVLFFSLRHNVKVYAIGDGGRVLVAKVKISAKNPVIDLTPLESHSDSRCYSLEIDKLTAKNLNGRTVEVIYGSARLNHKIAYEGNTYKVEADFHNMTITAIY